MSDEPGRLRRLARWALPSLAAAAIGGIVAGLVEGTGRLDLGGQLAAAGFVALVLVPVFAIALLGGRVVLAGWRLPAAEEGGGMPALAGWLVTIVIELAILAYAMNRATWFLARHVAFRVIAVGFLFPLIFVAALLVLVALSVPLARVATAAARALDVRWCARGRRTLLSPRRITTTAAILVVAGIAIAWVRVISPRIGPLDLGPLDAPVAGAVFTAAIVLAWPRLDRFSRARRRTGLAAIVASLALVGLALATPVVRPVTALEIWGAKPLAGLAIEKVYDLESIRAHVSLAAYRPVAKPGAAHPDIILITIDTVRADHTPPYGGKADMPVLAELALRGMTFEWAFSPSNVTRRSIPSLITGLSADRVHGRVVGWALRLDPRHVVLAERMAAGGYETAGFMCCDGFWGTKAKTGLQRGLEHLEIEHDGATLAKQGAAWLTAREAAHPTRPLFVWMHVIEPHEWTSLGPEPSDPIEREKLYDRSLAQCDPLIAELLRPFADRAPDRAPIVIITADHGEALGDHNTPYHSTDLYNSQTHVPLVVAGPGIPQGRIAESVSLTGLTPTIVDLAGFTTTDRHMDGLSWADLATGRRPTTDDGTAFMAMIKDRSNPGNVTALVRGHWKLVVANGREELYDIAADPKELVDRADREPAKLAEMHAAMGARNAAAQASPFE